LIIKKQLPSYNRNIEILRIISDKKAAETIRILLQIIEILYEENQALKAELQKMRDELNKLKREANKKETERFLVRKREKISESTKRNEIKRKIEQDKNRFYRSM